MIVNQDCWERGCACHDSRVDGPGVEVMKRPWVGLTDEEIKHEWEVWRASLPRYMGFAAGIEAKLKEKNNAS